MASSSRHFQPRGRPHGRHGLVAALVDAEEVREHVLDEDVRDVRPVLEDAAAAAAVGKSCGLIRPAPDV